MKGLVRHNGGWRSWRNAAVACLSAAFLLFSNSVSAASLEKIEVASALGEPLYAEVPLLLEGNELVSKVFIEIASAADYKIFEVYRDPILNSIRADVASDERGARVQLTSRTGIKTPFFNLVLKVRYGRVSHFKKYSVFLDSAKAIERIVAKEPLPHVDVAKIAAATLESGNQLATPVARSKLTESSGNALISKQTEEHAKLQAKQQAEIEQKNANNPVGWARTAKYGPIVRGDSLSIVADRLRLDHRYSGNQVMVALFEKNRESFDKENMNLIKAGSYLNSPSGEEVETLGRSEAFRVVANHEAEWKEQVHYPIQAEAQHSRYSNRVRFGEQADGEAAALVEKPAEVTRDLLKAEEESAPVASPSIEKPANVETATAASLEDLITPIEQLMQVQTETNQLLLALQEKNEALQQQLISNKKSVDGLREIVDEGAAAASSARVEKLEILLIRLQAQLERQVAQPTANTQETPTSNWITWILLSLVIVMLAMITMRMRKEPLHPASDQLLSESNVEPVTEQESKAGSLEEVVEEAVDSIETDETTDTAAKAGALDSMVNFSDVLSDADTAELEAFDADAKQEVDPNVDYLSEADVYIRYGMDDEALQQLDLALRVNPTNADAHVKKSELLHDKQDKAGFSAAVTAATVALAAVELEQYQAAVESFGGVVEMPAASPVASKPVSESLVETTEIEQAQTIAIDDTEIAELDFDLTGVEVAGVEKSQADADVAEVADGEPVDELNWLSDPSFAAEESSSIASSDDGLSFEQRDVSDDLPTVNAEDATDFPDTFDAGATQELGSLLSEFSDEEGAIEEFGNLLSEFNEPVSVEIKPLLSDVEPATEAVEELEFGGTQELGNLLSEFTETDDAQGDLLVMNAGPSTDATEEFGNLLSEFSGEAETESRAASGADATEEFGNLLSAFSGGPEAESRAAPGTDATETFAVMEGAKETIEITEPFEPGATQHLDSLLGEFADEEGEDLNFGSAVDDFDVTMIDEAKAESVSSVESLGIDLDHGATQELDSLLAEFSDEEGGLGLSFIDSSERLTADFPEIPGNNSGHGVTQELDSLLSEFADADDSNSSKSGLEHGVTQVLGNLLDEFNFDDDEGDKKS